MAHQKERQARMRLPYGPVDPANIILYYWYPVYVIAMAQKPALPCLVHREVGCLPMSPLIRNPNLNTLAAKPPGKPVVTERMLSHAVYDMQNRIGFPPSAPAPQEKPDSAARFKPPVISFDIPPIFGYT
jgi:hypothetical protein